LTAKASITQSTSLYFGVDVAYGGIAATEQLIDNVSSYTNFFIIGCTGNYNLTTLTTISQYVYNKGLSFIVFSDANRYPSAQWLAYAKSTFGSSFLGIYYFDEPGGEQLDQQDYPTVPAAEVNLNQSTYSDLASTYVNSLNYWLRSGPFAITNNFASPNEFPLFTSDYAFYWYDYEAGYDTVFAEFTMNYSIALNVALCRGAATVQNKSWGVMIDWQYTQSPYLPSGPDLFSDMKYAYTNGAKYIVVFDTNANYTQNVLTPQLESYMKQFWQYAQANPKDTIPISERTAYVLPEAYAYGFRGPQDKIWGLWRADSLTTDLSMSVSTLLKMDGDNLDIVYPDEPQALQSAGYQTIVNWDNPNLIPTSSPASSPFYASSIFLYATTAGIISAAVVAFIALKFRKRS
jgi:hypothetical protein